MIYFIINFIAIQNFNESIEEELNKEDSLWNNSTRQTRRVHIFINLKKPPRACFPSGGGTDVAREHSIQTMKKLLLRRQDSNLWPQGYDPCELPSAPPRPHVRRTHVSCNKDNAIFRNNTIYQWFTNGLQHRETLLFVVLSPLECVENA